MPIVLRRCQPPSEPARRLEVVARLPWARWCEFSQLDDSRPKKKVAGVKRCAGVERVLEYFDT